MENKKYLDKVIGSLVRSTKMDYENKKVNTPFFLDPSFELQFILPFTSSSLLFPSLTSPFFFSFSSYCRNYFGLTKDEIRYLWKEYKNIINDKIENGE